MSGTDICGRLRDWCERYPSSLDLAEENAAARADENNWLGRFAGLDALDREQVIELIGWKFQSMAHRRALAVRGVSPERWGGQDGAAELIRRVLANGDDDQALATVCGIDRFGPAMGSVILAAYRPDRYTVADSNALKALRGLGLMPAGPPGFRQGDWLPYLMACRSLARRCGTASQGQSRAARSRLVGRESATCIRWVVEEFGDNARRPADRTLAEVSDDDVLHAPYGAVLIGTMVLPAGPEEAHVLGVPKG